MKLITITTFTYLIITLLVFVIGGFFFYNELKKILDEEATEQLYFKKNQLISATNKSGALPTPLSFDGLIAVKNVSVPAKERTKDTLLYIEQEEELLPYRFLFFNLKLKGGNYETILCKPTFETDDLIETIINSFIILAIVLVVILLIANFLVSRKILAPFFHSLDLLKNYQIEQHQSLSFKKTGTQEFDQLNDAIYKMTSKISSDFNNLKAFAENASHELQTPLAIIKTKTELLLQTENLSEELAKPLMEINQTASRSAKLNQTLLLLSKIENNQFSNSEVISFSEIVKKKIELYADLAAIKNIQLKTHIQPAELPMHPLLADIVVSNLLSNALKHSPAQGKMFIELSASQFRVSNAGSVLRSTPDQLFIRFHKENSEGDSTGLGLALVKQISILSKHSITYNYINGMHVFTYTF